MFNSYLRLELRRKNIWHAGHQKKWPILGLLPMCTTNADRIIIIIHFLFGIIAPKGAVKTLGTLKEIHIYLALPSISQLSATLSLLKKTGFMPASC